MMDILVAQAVERYDCSERSEFGPALSWANKNSINLIAWDNFT